VFVWLQRLLIAKDYGDRSAERRACSNLGNAHIFLGNFSTAAEYYQSVLACIGIITLSDDFIMLILVCVLCRYLHSDFSERTH